MSALGSQFEHPAGGYQLSLPGMTRPELGVSRHTEGEYSDNIAVSHIFKQPRKFITLSSNDNLSTQFKDVPTTALHPTQPDIHEDYLNEPSKSKGSPEVKAVGNGQYHIIDGHHRVARALLNENKTLRVKVYGGP